MALQQNDYDGLEEYDLPELAKHGNTPICDARTYWKRNHHETWIKLANEDKLTARVNLGLWAYPTEEDASQIAMLKSLYQNDANKFIDKINPGFKNIFFYYFPEKILPELGYARIF